MAEMARRTEQEIVARWRSRGLPLASVVCTTYNQARYLREGLDSFLMQETDFPFEVIVHDDASTDGSAEIVREYAARYPGIVFPILQSENQYSQGKSTPLIAFGRARGEYVFLCEGDDFWTDPEKLAVQVAAMGRHPQCQISFHPALRTFEDGSAPSELICRRFTGNAIVDAREVILWGGSYMPTASLCFRREFVERMLDPVDTFFKRFLIDYFAQIFGSLHGGALFIDRTMSVHRCMSPGSWSSTVNSDGSALLAWAEKILRGMAEADALTGGAYRAEFGAVGNRFHCSMLSHPVLSRERRGEYYLRHREEMALATRALWLLLFRNGPMTGGWHKLRLLYGKLRSFGLFRRKGGGRCQPC